MDRHDSRNVQRVLRRMAAEWRCPVWMVERTIQQIIDQSWEQAMLDPKTKALWDQYFPNGKPTPEEYILLLGHAHEKGEYIPYLLKD